MSGAEEMSPDKLQEHALRRWAALKQERSSWDSHWRELSENIQPRSSRFMASDRNKGDKRHNKIYDNTATQASDVLAAGMMSGMSSPARPWFRLTTSDPDLIQLDGVKRWLSTITDVMMAIFARSNTYRALHGMYEELAIFGTAASVITPDFKQVINHHTLTAGEFAIALDGRGQADTVYREFEMTVGQMVGTFGYEACSQRVREAYTRGHYDLWQPVLHAIEPRRGGENKPDAFGHELPWRSVYMEVGGDKGKLLREGGFKSFPALCPRWAVNSNDTYGRSPGMAALGDIKQLQHQQLRKAQAIDYKTRPPLQLPTGMKGYELDMLPGGVSFVDTAGGSGAGIRSVFEVNLDLNDLRLDIEDVRNRIKGSFYADLFLMLANNIHPQMTATEVAERHEEKLLMLGPVLERLHNEILEPLIEATFERMIEAGMVPPPPEELAGQELSVEFVSMLAQAQRAVATNSIDRFVMGLGQIAGMKPEVLDKLDADKWADMYADALGVDPHLLVPGEQVALIRQERAQAQQAQAQAEQMAQGAEMARALSQADTSEKNALTDMTQAFSGYS